MIEVRLALPIDSEQLSLDLESREEITEWMFEEDLARQVWIYGYFEDPEMLSESWGVLRERYPDWKLPEHPPVRELADADWQDSYRKFFSPRSFGRLHWVPGWQRETYPLPEGDVALYLDPGLAFGTGEHETTQLCMEFFQRWSAEVGPEVGHDALVVDAGCGSGILALSARLLGHTKILAFDNDPQSVEVADRNREENEIPADWTLRLADLNSGLAGVQAECIMANIHTEVLLQGLEPLIGAVRPGGTLILSGILSRELEEVQTAFEAGFRAGGRTPEVTTRVLGEWSAAVFS